MTIPANPLPSLADEVLAALPALMIAFPAGPGVAEIADHLGADRPSVRRAMRQLNADARADMMRRLHSREHFLVPLKSRGIEGYRLCACCGREFTVRPRRHRRTCSRPCSIKWSWTRPGVAERRIGGIKKQRATPAAQERLAAHNRRRWSDPAQRQRLADWNRRRWADPATKADLARAIAAVQRTPEMRRLYSELRKTYWQDPEKRKLMLAGIRRSKSSPEARALFSGLLKARWQDPVLRPKYLAAVKVGGAKAAAKKRGTKEPPEVTRKRVESRRRNAAARMGMA